VRTADNASQLMLTADRNIINADGEDLSFVTIKVTDKNGLTVPDANNEVTFSIEGPGEIAATDNGDPSNLVSFNSTTRAAFSGLALVIIRSKKGESGNIKLYAKSPGLKDGKVEVTVKKL
jgi:beta-galactosidase